MTSYNDNQKKIYNRYINLNKYKDILEKKDKDIEFYKKLCGNSQLEIRKYLMTLGITDNSIIESMIYAAKECDLTTMNITSEETSDLNNGNLFMSFLHNFFISYYSPYYDLFYKLMLIIGTIHQMKTSKTTIDWSKINKSIFNNKINIITELINELSPNTKLIEFFDLNNLKTILSSIDITCNTNDCVFTNNNDSTLDTKLEKMMKSQIVNNMPITSVNFLITDFDKNFIIKEENTNKTQPEEDEKNKKIIKEEQDKDKNNKLYLIISAGIIAVIVIITVIILIIRRNNFYNNMYPYGNMGYGNSMGSMGSMGYGGI